MADRICGECGGHGTIQYGRERFVDCTTCNGTGIAGNPRVLFLVMVLSALLTIGLVIHFFGKLFGH